MTIDTLEGAVLLPEPDGEVGGQLDDPAGFPSGRGSEEDPIQGTDLVATVEREPGVNPDAEKDQPPAWLFLVLIAGAAFLIFQSFGGRS